MISLAGSAFEEDRIVALSTGCDDFVHKPFRTEVIFEKMAEHLGVRYLYGSPQLRSSSPENSSALPQKSTLPPDELRQALVEMPVDWLEQLHQAATKVNAKQILQLIEQIPLANVPLANALNHLVKTFVLKKLLP